jgi:hypothetical protein
MSTATQRKLKRAFALLIALWILRFSGGAAAAFVPCTFAPGPTGATFLAHISFPQQPILNDPRGYFLEVTGLLSKNVSHPCGPVAPYTKGPSTLLADVTVDVPDHRGSLHVFGYGHTANPSPQLYRFDALFYLTPQQAAYLQGGGQASVGVRAYADSFSTHYIFRRQPIVNAELSLTPAPLPSAGWFLLVGLASLLRFAKRDR